MALSLGDEDGDIDAVASQTVYSNLERQLAWRGLPRIDHTLTLDLWGSPNGSWVLLIALRRTRLLVPHYGILQLDPSSLLLLRLGALDGSGGRTLEVKVPGDPTLVDLTVYSQALVSSPKPRFSNLEIITLTDR
jgi:hypothetical protein